jgi:hypothetical protein
MSVQEKLCSGEAGGGVILDKVTLPKLPAKALRNTVRTHATQGQGLNRQDDDV